MTSTRKTGSTRRRKSIATVSLRSCDAKGEGDMTGYLTGGLLAAALLFLPAAPVSAQTTVPAKDAAKEPVSSGVGVVALEGQVERKCAEHEQQAERNRPGLVDGDKPRVLAWSHHDVMRLPEQCVVRADFVRSRLDLEGAGLAELHDGDRFPVNGDEHLAKAGILRWL